MARFTVLYDACVLYPAPLRDLLMQLATARLFHARWTNKIHDEWIRSLISKRPELVDKLQRTREFMNKAVLDCLIENYEDLIPGLTLPDPDDRHILAAAIAGGAAVIVTSNLKHFPDAALQKYGIDAQHPDEFISCQFDLNPAVACSAIKKLRQRLQNPRMPLPKYIETIERQGLPRTAIRMKQFDNLL